RARLGRRATEPRRVLPITLPVLALVLTGMLIYTHGYHIDLEVYRLGVATWLAGGDMYGPLPPTLSGLALPFIYPPFAAMVLLPLEMLPWTAAWIALYAVSVSSVAVTLYVVARRLWPEGGRPGALSVASAALPVALVLEPVLETVKFGQVNLVLMALVAVDCLAERTRWPRGLLVGIAAAIKLTPAAFVLFFLLRGDRRAAVVTVVTAAAATGLGFAVDPASSARYWFGGPAAGISGSVFYTNQTIQAVLARAEVPALAAKAVWFAATVALLVLIVPVVRRAELALALVTVAGFALLVSPTSWSHHWVWIAPALLVVVAQAVRLGSRGWAAAAAVLVVTFTVAPFRWLPHEHEAELSWTAAQQVVGATYVIAGVLALVAVRRAVTSSVRSAPATPTS
ncbi:MAG TPA: glycosyltransferase 87 family protein, partial [Actinomycetales bacterium]